MPSVDGIFFVIVIIILVSFYVIRSYRKHNEEKSSTRHETLAEQVTKESSHPFEKQSVQLQTPLVQQIQSPIQIKSIQRPIATSQFQQQRNVTQRQKYTQQTPDPNNKRKVSRNEYRHASRGLYPNTILQKSQLETPQFAFESLQDMVDPNTIDVKEKPTAISITHRKRGHAEEDGTTPISETGFDFEFRPIIQRKRLKVPPKVSGQNLNDAATSHVATSKWKRALDSDTDDEDDEYVKRQRQLQDSDISDSYVDDELLSSMDMDEEESDLISIDESEMSSTVDTDQDSPENLEQDSVVSLSHTSADESEMHKSETEDAGPVSVLDSVLYHPEDDEEEEEEDEDNEVVSEMDVAPSVSSSSSTPKASKVNHTVGPLPAFPALDAQSKTRTIGIPPTAADCVTMYHDTLIPEPLDDDKVPAGSRVRRGKYTLWRNGLGQQFCKNEDGELRTLTKVRIYRYKYDMPQDSMHLDRFIVAPFDEDRWLTAEQYKDARLNFRLSSQELVPLSDEEREFKFASSTRPHMVTESIQTDPLLTRSKSSNLQRHPSRHYRGPVPYLHNHPSNPSSGSYASPTAQMQHYSDTNVTTPTNGLVTPSSLLTASHQTSVTATPSHSTTPVQTPSFASGRPTFSHIRRNKH